MSGIWIGTSGWTCDGWHRPFYPADVSKKRWLSWYATQFPTTEINGSFYRTPSLDAVRRWRDETPDDFVFVWKASKLITHWKRLTAKCKNSLALMETRLKALGPKAGPVLFQLSPQFQADRERLAGLLKMLSKRRRYAFEFRHQSWYEQPILDLLSERDIALCLLDHYDTPAPWEVTASHVYVRGHGPSGRYKDRYPLKTLRSWTDSIARWKRQRRDVFCYFDNDQKSAAPLHAERLMKLVAAGKSASGRATRS